MNFPAADPQPFAAGRPTTGWSWKKTICLILLAFAAHVAFIFLLGAKKTAPPRAATNVPLLRLADNSSELVRLTDPTLFALPHAEDFGASAWPNPPAITDAAFSYTEPPSFLPLAAAGLGAAFNFFMQTNGVAALPLDFKPQPQITAPAIVIATFLPQHSTWQLGGALAARAILRPPAVPTLAVDDVIPPSRVQLLVDQNGNIDSAVLLESSGDDAADQQALGLARALRFAPADKPMFGEIIFQLAHRARQRALSINLLLVIYVALALGAICVVGIYSELERRRFGPAHPEDRVFRCAKCHLVYTDDADVDRSRCTQCGKLNEPIVF